MSEPLLIICVDVRRCGGVVGGVACDVVDAAEDGAEQHRGWTPVKRPFCESGPCSISRPYRRLLSPPRRSHRRALRLLCHRCVCQLLTGSGCSPSAGEAPTIGWFHPGSSRAHLLRVRSEPPSVGMDEDNHGKVFLFSILAPLVGLQPPPTSQHSEWDVSWDGGM